MFDVNELYSDRIGGKNYLNNGNIYRFSKIKKAREEYKKNGYEILDFGIGEPDKKANDKVIDSLYEEAKKWENREYADNGCLKFNKACKGYLMVEQGVDIDYKSEIMHCMGIKEALNILPLAFVNKDDYVITITPGYNVMSNMAKWLGAKVYEYKLNKFNNYLIDFDDIDENILKKCKLLYLNYPHNPTGAVATREFFKKVVQYAKKYNFIVVHDAAYLDLCFDEASKISFLSVEGAKDVGVELYSFSKGFNMTGWRIGFIAGNKDIIKVYGTVKENLDSGQFLAIQKASITALNNYEIITKEMKKMYLRRHELVKNVLEKHGFKSSVPKAGFYQYVSIPKSCNKVTFESAEEFALWLLNNAYIVVIPYDVEEGKYIRFSMTFIAKDEEDEKRVVEELDKRLAKYKFEFK